MNRFVSIDCFCGEHFEYGEMEGDHIKPWGKGGQTIPDNYQMLCKFRNAKKDRQILNKSSHIHTMSGAKKAGKKSCKLLPACHLLC